MSLSYVVDGETELSSELFNPWVDQMNGLQTGALPIALLGIEGALGDWEPTSRAETRVLDARARGVVADGVTDDRQALLDAAEDAYDNKVALWIPDNIAIDGPLDFTEFYGLAILGSGHNASPAYGNVASRIVQHASNEPILRLYGPCRVEDLYLAYANQQGTGDTASIAVELNKISGGFLNNLKVYRANTSFGIPQVGFGDSSNWVYNTTLGNINSYEASECHLDLRNYNGGGTNVIVLNFYANGGGSLDFVTSGQSCNHVIRGANWKGYHVGVLSIDGAIIDDAPIKTENNCFWSAGHIRFEACTVTPDDVRWIENSGAHSSFHLGMLEMKNDRWDAESPTNMYLLGQSSTFTDLDVGHVYCASDCDFGGSGFRRVLYLSGNDAGSGYTSRVLIGPIYDESGTLTDTNSWTDGLGNARTPVQVWDGAVVNHWFKAGRTGEKRRHIYDTALPVAGTYVAGDRCTILAPALGLPTEYVCTAGGTPGIWRPAGQTVKQDTTANRPSPAASDIGILYLDTTIDADGKPIWWNGTAWVDATGATV